MRIQSPVRTVLWNLEEERHYANMLCRVSCEIRTKGRALRNILFREQSEASWGDGSKHCYLQNRLCPAKCPAPTCTEGE